MIIKKVLKTLACIVMCFSSAPCLAADGGTVTLNGKKITISPNATLKANASDGKAGTIWLVHKGDTDFDLSNVTIFATNLTSSNDVEGGTVLIQTSGASSVILESTIISADGSGAKNGGVISIITPVDVDISKPAVVTAKGGVDGFGGTISIAKAKNPFNSLSLELNKLYRVSGGANKTGLGDAWGSLSLNGVQCFQFYAYSDYPRTIWNCVDNNSALPSVDWVRTYSASLVFELKDRLKNDVDKSTHIYVFSTMSAAVDFMGNPSDMQPHAYGMTWPVNSGDQYLLVTESLQNSPFSMDEIIDIAAHETGHAVALRRGFEDRGINFRNHLKEDLIHLDYAVVGLYKATSTLRPACSSNGTAPFDNVIDKSTKTYICDPVFHTLDPKFFVFGVPMANSQILAIADPQLNSDDPSDFYAVSFAYQWYEQTFSDASASFSPTAYGLMKNGYFPCIRGWAGALRYGSFTPPSVPGYSCLALAPIDY